MISWWRRRPEHLTDDDLSAYLDNQTSSRETARFRAHIVGCEECRERLDEMRNLRSMLSQITRPTVPRSFVLSPEQAGEQIKRASVATPAQPSHWRIPAFVPAAALTVFLAVMAVDLGGSTVSQESDSGGGATSAPARAGYSVDDASKSGEATTLSAPGSSPAPESAFSSVPPQAPVAPVAPSTANSEADAAPDTARSIPAPSTGGGTGGVVPQTSPAVPQTSPAQPVVPVPPVAQGPRTGEVPATGGTAVPSAAQASVPPPATTITGDTFGAAGTDLAATNPDASSQIGIEPGQEAGARPGAATRDASGGPGSMAILEIALFLVFLASLLAVIWQRVFSKGVR